MKPLDLFMPYVLPHVPECPSVTAYQALVQAAYDFCTETDIVQCTERLDVVADQPTYSFEAAPQQNAHRLVRAFYKANALPIAPLDAVLEANALLGEDADDPVTGRPQAAFLRSPSSCDIGVYPVPTSADTGYFVFVAAFSPVRNATQLADVLFDNWLDPVAARAVTKLKMLPGQLFSGPSLDMERVYAAGVARARVEARKARVRSSLRVTGPSFSSN